MMELIQITNDPALAQRCDALAGMRLFVDLERHGKAERQAGRNTFISNHQLDDVGRIKAVLQRAPLMVRVNPLHAGSAAEVQAGERTQTSLLQQARASRDAVSGVNRDEEAANLVRFQQSYQAAAKVMGVAQRLFDEMLAIAR